MHCRAPARIDPPRAHTHLDAARARTRAVASPVHVRATQDGEIDYSVDTRNGAQANERASTSDAAEAAEAAARAVKTPHSGYHRQVGVDRAFFEGWYFRFTLPDSRESASLIYHVYDPDAKDSKRASAGAQVCAPNGKYLYKTHPRPKDFEGSPRALEFGLKYDDGGYFETTREGTRHAGSLTSAGESEDGPWSGKKSAREISWDITVTPLRGWGGGEGANMVSPAGWMTALPVFEPHWQVTMAHGLASGWIETDGERVELCECPAYSEKNWGGAGFPLKWWWAQCNSFPDYPDLSVTATGGNRGVVILPNVREDVGAVGVHFGDRFFQFVPAQQVEVDTSARYGAESVLEASAVHWDIKWGSWNVSAVGERYECEIKGTCTDDDRSTVIRAPTDSLDEGMAPLCRETFTGVVTVHLWRLNAQGARVETIIDGASSDTACLEIGGGPWLSAWKSVAEIRTPLGPLMGLPIDMRFVANALSPFGNFLPGL
jgi:tocopherol cyclase